MSRSEFDVQGPRSIVFIAIAAVSLAAIATGCTPQAPLSARVVDDTVTVSAPSLHVPVPDLDAGFVPPQGDGGQQDPRTASPTAAAVVGLGQYSRVESAPVLPGDRVAAGEVIAVFETAALDATVHVAKARRASAKAQVAVIGSALDEIDSGRSDLADARGELFSATARLRRTRADLVTKRAEVKKLLAQVEKAAGLRPPSGSIPGTLPPGVAPPQPPNPAQLRAAIGKLDAGIAKLDAGLAKAKAGQTRLAGVRASLDDAESQLEDARVLARIAADTAAVAVELAQWQRSVATVRAPCDGTIVRAVRAGDVLARDASVAVIRTDGAARLTTWVTPAEAADLERRADASTGSGETLVTVGADWLGDGFTLPARITRIGTRAQYPPTSFATKEVHLTRAVFVEVTMDSTSTALPPGAPADVWIR